MAVDVVNRKGKTVRLLNPAEKGRKYAGELKRGKRYTNEGTAKRDKNGNHISLTKSGKAYRSGYLDARKDSAKAFKSKNPGYVRKKK